MPNRLFVDELVSVGMVASGDNPEAEVVIYKSRDSDTRQLESPPTNNTAGSGPLEEKVNMDLSVIEDADIRKAVADHVASLEAQIPEPAPEDVAKDADPEVQEFIAKLQESQEDLQKQLDDERTARRTAEYVEKAKAFTKILGKAEDMGPVLADLADKAPDSYAKLEPALQALAQRTELDSLFKELGSGEAEGETDPLSKRDAWVAKNRQDGETVTQARGRFWDAHPEAKQESREG